MVSWDTRDPFQISFLVHGATFAPRAHEVQLRALAAELPLILRMLGALTIDGVSRNYFGLWPEYSERREGDSPTTRVRGRSSNQKLLAIIFRQWKYLSTSDDSGSDGLRLRVDDGRPASRGDECGGGSCFGAVTMTKQMSCYLSWRWVSPLCSDITISL